MTPNALARSRLATQRISATAFTRPDEVVAWLGAVQAQDYLGALWAIGLRLQCAREGDVERALADGSIVRTWPMRGTLHFVAAADARWMTELLGPRMLTRAAGRLASFGIDAADLARARRVLVQHLEGGRRLDRPALYRVLERAKISTDKSRGLHLLWALAHERLVCFGPREEKRQTFVLFDEWLPGARPLSREDSLRELAVRYFTGHGPATLADFAWWSGLALADVRRAVLLAHDELDEVTRGGALHWFGRGTPPPGASRGGAHLLPAFDEFLVGYKDRTAVLDAADTRRVNDGGGMLHPTIVVNGRVVGTWKRRIARGGVVFLPAPFRPLSRAQTEALTRAVERYARFVGLDLRADRKPPPTRR